MIIWMLFVSMVNQRACDSRGAGLVRDKVDHCRSSIPLPCPLLQPARQPEVPPVSSHYGRLAGASQHGNLRIQAHHPTFNPGLHPASSAGGRHRYQPALDAGCSCRCLTPLATNGITTRRATIDSWFRDLVDSVPAGGEPHCTPRQEPSNPASIWPLHRPIRHQTLVPPATQTLTQANPTCVSCIGR